MDESATRFGGDNDSPLENPVSRYSVYGRTSSMETWDNADINGQDYEKAKASWESYDVTNNWDSCVWGWSGSDWWGYEDGTGEKTEPKNPVTTFMLRNIPNKYCQKELLEDLELLGFKPAIEIDFFYLPVDQETGANLGYAFINLTSVEGAKRFRKLNGAQLPRYVTRKVIVVGVATVQGLEENWAFYQRSSAMRNSDLSRRPLFWPKADSAMENASANALGPTRSWGKTERRGSGQCESVSSSDDNKDDDKEDSFPEYEKVPNEDNVNEQGWVSTLMLRNIRNKYGQKDLLAEFEGLGFFPGVHVDFFYLPVDSNTGSNLGYAFVNFINPKATENFQKLNGKESYLFKKKILVVDKATVQGLQMNWDLYQRSSSMNSSDVSRRPLFWPQKELVCRQEAYKPQSADQVPRVPVCSSSVDTIRTRRSKRSSSTKEDVAELAAYEYNYNNNNNMTMPPGLDDRTPASEPSRIDAAENELFIEPPRQQATASYADVSYDPSRQQSSASYTEIPYESRQQASAPYAEIPYEASRQQASTVYTEIPYESLHPPNPAAISKTCLIDRINEPPPEHQGAKFCGNCGTRRTTSREGVQRIPAVFCTECGTRFDRFEVSPEDFQANTNKLIGSMQRTASWAYEDASDPSQWELPSHSV